jgi:hypothetical protein
MRHSLIRFSTVATAILVAGGLFVTPLMAQQRVDRRPAPQPVEVAPPRAVGAMDAEDTRRALLEILQRHPPSVGRVLKVDPSLLRNESYLETYPQLREFLAAHPEIPQNAGYYLEPIHGVGDWTPRNPRMELMEGILAGLAVFAGFAVFIGTVAWLIRTVLDQRRWNRLSKIQAEVHTKLMDRFSSNDELLAYVQTPSGRRFLESGPSPLQETPPAMGAPFSRILWSVQVGAVLLVTGAALLLLSGRSALVEAREFFFVAGSLASALGAGFVVSAGASYALSRRLGLIDRPAQNNA